MRWALLMLGLAACIEPTLLVCPGSGLACPAGLVCDELHATCVTQQQLQSCVGLPDDKGCAVGTISGYCRDQICLPIVCGNHIVDLSEACDDGNSVRGDGCSATCTSTEQCGNGVIDTVGDEQCDDANLIDRDGCDSRCQLEQVEWSVRGVSLRGRGPGRMTYDSARQEMLYYAGSTWRYDGVRWSMITAAGPPLASKELIVDVRDRVLYLGQNGSGVINETWEWDGIEWTRRPTQNPPTPSLGFLGVYDPVRKVVLVVGRTGGKVGTWSLDPVAGAWVRLADVSATSMSPTWLAFDEARGVAVLVASTTTFEWDGTVWTPTAAPPPPILIGGAVMYDPREGAVIAIIGADVVKWTGTSWSTLAAQELPDFRSDPSVAWDAGRQRRIVFGGAGAEPLADSFEWDGVSWQHVSVPDAPFLGNILVPALGITYDPLRGELIQIGTAASDGSMAAWALGEAGWRPLPSAPFPATQDAAIAFDPVRGGVVINTPSGGTWLLANDTWTTIEPISTSAANGFRAMSYDPIRGALVAVNSIYETWELGSTAQGWRQANSFPDNGGRPSLAFDARAGRTLMSVGVSVFELVGDTWEESPLSPGVPYVVTESAPRGSVLFLGRGPTTTLWERLDGSYRELESPSFVSFAANAVATPDGTLRILVQGYGTVRLLWERRYVGGGPRDVCTGNDEDGDQRVDCADVDCWASCSPACPPYASCP